MPPFPGFVGPAYQAQSRIVGAEVCRNWYPQRVESPSPRVQYALYPTPGLASFATGMESPIRGIFAQDGRCFAVGGAKFYEIAADGTATSRGSVASDPWPAMIDTFGAAGNQLVIFSGGEGYTYNLTTNVLTQITDADFPSDVAMGVIAEEVVAVLHRDTAQFSISSLLDGASWDASDTAQKSNSFDNVRAIAWHQAQLWLMGSRTIEPWGNNGDPAFPFAPVGGAVIEQGIGAAYSVVKADNSLFWLGEHSSGASVVYRSQGYTPVRVSTDAIEYAIAQYATVSDAIGWTYQMHGQSFYVLSFPTGGTSWVLNISSGFWHEWSYRNPTTGLDEAHLGRCHAFAFGHHLVGSRRDGTVYRMASDLYDDAGDPIRRVRRTPHTGPNRGRVFYNSLVIDLEVGQGLTSGQGSDPQAMLRWSNDGGQTYGNEHMAAAGARGVYSAQVEFHRLGSAVKPRVWELVVSDPIPWRVAGADLTADGGRH